MVARIAGRSGVVERHTLGPLTLLGLSPRITKPLAPRPLTLFGSASHQEFLEESSSETGFFHLISHHLSKDGVYNILIEEWGRGKDSLEIQGS